MSAPFLLRSFLGFDFLSGEGDGDFLFLALVYFASLLFAIVVFDFVLFVIDIIS